MSSATDPALEALRQRLEKQHLGDPQLIELLMAALLGQGHVLLEGAPGLGKTRLLRGLAQAVDLDFQRVQGTPDLMPGDVTGGDILDQVNGVGSFRFEKGPLFTQVCLFDEINRATPRTQAALLEAMAERQVTVGGVSHALPQPFLVAATQNPIELEGTYPLPEAQLDRFLFQLFVKSPSTETLVDIFRMDQDHASTAPAVLDAPKLLTLQANAAALPVADTFLQQLAVILRATDPQHESAPQLVHESVSWGASPRGGLAALAGARGLALLRGRGHVAPEDLRDALFPALRHRVLLRYEAAASGITGDTVLEAVLQKHPLQ
ncbi:MAG: AAA family ATPase [Planctomycetota bacterium]|nr:AAA family ATPase [Planctomycetota bacterium]MDA1113058.1 AAA family ATPase [Planctomycetota bacterium]